MRDQHFRLIACTDKAKLRFSLRHAHYESGKQSQKRQVTIDTQFFGLLRPHSMAMLKLRTSVYLLNKALEALPTRVSDSANFSAKWFILC